MLRKKFRSTANSLLGIGFRTSHPHELMHYMYLAEAYGMNPLEAIPSPFCIVRDENEVCPISSRSIDEAWRKALENIKFDRPVDMAALPGLTPEARQWHQEASALMSMETQELMADPSWRGPLERSTAFWPYEIHLVPSYSRWAMALTDAIVVMSLATFCDAKALMGALPGVQTR